MYMEELCFLCGFGSSSLLAWWHRGCWLNNCKIFDGLASLSGDLLFDPPSNGLLKFL